MPWTREHQTLTRYLLGELSESPMVELEKRLLADEDLFERLPIVEDDLIDAYVRGEMQSSRRQRFELRFLTLPKRRVRVELARNLLAMAESYSATDSVKLGSFVGPCRPVELDQAKRHAPRVHDFVDRETTPFSRMPDVESTKPPSDPVAADALRAKPASGETMTGEKTTNPDKRVGLMQTSDATPPSLLSRAVVLSLFAMSIVDLVPGGPEAGVVFLISLPTLLLIYAVRPSKQLLA